MRSTAIAKFTHRPRPAGEGARTTGAAMSPEPRLRPPRRPRSARAATNRVPAGAPRRCCPGGA
eukprot:3947083-Lingulodinium_polyedra.AAC.1